MPASRIAAALGLFLGLSGASLACVSDPDAQRMSPDAGGMPAVYVILDQAVISKPTGLSLVVCDGDVLDVFVDARMPAHQHGMNYEPDIEDLGEGRFVVTNMVYHMPGLWQLKVTLDTGSGRSVHVLDMPIR